MKQLGKNKQKYSITKKKKKKESMNLGFSKSHTYIKIITV